MGFGSRPSCVVIVQLATELSESELRLSTVPINLTRPTLEISSGSIEALYHVAHVLNQLLLYILSCRAVEDVLNSISEDDVLVEVV